MNPPDHDTPPPSDTTGARIIRTAGTTMASLVLIFAVASIAGGIGVWFGDGRLTQISGTAIGLGVALLAAAGMVMRAAQPALFGGRTPTGPQTGKKRSAFLLSVAAGVVIGVALSLAALDSPGGAFGNGPLDPTFALVFVVLYCVLTPVTAVLWYRHADEFERAASDRGALVGLYGYSLIAPAWWVLSRAGFLPPQEPMIVFLCVMLIWGSAWLFSRGH